MNARVRLDCVHVDQNHCRASMGYILTTDVVFANDIVILSLEVLVVMALKTTEGSETLWISGLLGQDQSVGSCIL